jgi:hypothetical protein
MALGGFLLVLVYLYGVHLPPVEAQGTCGPGQQASMPVLPGAASAGG